MKDSRILIKWIAVIVASLLTYFIVFAGFFFAGRMLYQPGITDFSYYAILFIAKAFAIYCLVAIGVRLTELDKDETFKVLYILAILILGLKLIAFLGNHSPDRLAELLGVFTGMGITLGRRFLQIR